MHMQRLGTWEKEDDEKRQRMELDRKGTIKT